MWFTLSTVVLVSLILTLFKHLRGRCGLDRMVVGFKIKKILKG